MLCWTLVPVRWQKDPAGENLKKTMVEVCYNSVVEAPYKPAMEDTVYNENAVVNTLSAVEVTIDRVTGENVMVDTSPEETTVMDIAAGKHSAVEILNETVDLKTVKVMSANVVDGDVVFDIGSGKTARIDNTSM